MTDVFVVEIWSNELTHMSGGDPSHDVNVCHLASSEKQAIEWCKRHTNYGGYPGLKGYYPWHFKISRKLLNEDMCCTVGLTDELVWDSRDEDETIIDAEYEEVDEDTEEEIKFNDDWDDDENDFLKCESKLTFVEKLPALLRGIAEVVEEHLGDD